MRSKWDSITPGILECGCIICGETKIIKVSKKTGATLGKSILYICPSCAQGGAGWKALADEKEKLVNAYTGAKREV